MAATILLSYFLATQLFVFKFLINEKMHTLLLWKYIKLMYS